MVSRPNDWQKTVKTAGNAAETRPVTPKNAARQALFTEVLTAANTRQQAISVPTPQRGDWISFSKGPFGYWCLSVISDGRLRVEAYIDTYEKGLNKALFDELAADAAGWEAKTGLELLFERLDDKIASRIAAYKPIDLDHPAGREAARRWPVETLVAMHEKLNMPLRASATARLEKFSDSTPPTDAQI
ncbi:DUF4268 domain-containing protein [Rhodococcus sp. LB1]|uniref:DUF4268 domain-containing protein n=1 Tax=Rhodococcus sp. LB1 TaxID=1807499 RepID=UPI000B0CC5C9|nr:DUF4268 domain-containing protein [Rhodococcus sp. LB1]